MDAVDDRGRLLGRLQKTLDDYVDFLYHTLIMRVYVSHPSAMYRRDSVLRLGGYDEATGPAEDKDLWRKLALERFEARIVPEPLVRYRLHDQQLSQTRAGYQRQVDGASQERFLEQLSPEGPARPVRLLLARRANVHASDRQGRTALGWARRRGDRAIEVLLRGAGAREEEADPEGTRTPEAQPASPPSATRPPPAALARARGGRPAPRRWRRRVAPRSPRSARRRPPSPSIRAACAHRRTSVILGA